MGESGTGGEGKRRRKINDAGGGKKRRRYLPHNKSVKKKGSYPLHPGVEGFFITCDGGREYQASSEALNILDSFFEELVHGGNSSIKQLSNKPLNKKITFEDSDSSDSDDDDDVEEENKVEQNAVEEENKVEQNAVEEENKVKQNAGEEENKVEQNAGEEENEVEENEGEKEDEEKGDKKQKLDVCSADNGNHDETGMGEKSDAHKIDDKNAHELPKADDNKGEIDEDNTIVKTTDKLPDMKADAPTCGLKDKVEEKSIDKLIEEELKELGDKTKRRFIKLDSGCNGVVFVQMRKKDGEKGPKDIAQHIVTSAAATRKHMSRFILRILPIEATCYASKEEISKAMQPLVERYFPSETENPQKFAVLYEARANTGIDKMEIIDAVAKSIPGPHKVDLSNPDKTIVVEIARTVCMLGVIDKYKELSKYNLRQLTSQKV
ncbi:hypothetical protein TanjilG_22140 [Lupinus angustifolius]|uniref:THUMP domain-containing protein n=1 Tax=Lupinus angustifolius TaxID=3871 RepID=A0A4P1QTW3_LUPAN|nr:PREDICTED: uncharacterized protein LOC109331730 [Lupinus angustifolius]OIV94943.1 hypothetical protein TanjilG_22140 [Lupinus angustifolius]